MISLCADDPLALELAQTFLGHQYNTDTRIDIPGTLEALIGNARSLYPISPAKMIVFS